MVPFSIGSSHRLFIGGLLQTHQNVAPAVLLWKRHNNHVWCSVHQPTAMQLPLLLIAATGASRDTIRMRGQFHCLRKTRKRFRNWKQQSVMQPKKCIVSSSFPPDTFDHQDVTELSISNQKLFYTAPKMNLNCQNEQSTTTWLCAGFDADHFLSILYVFAGQQRIKVEMFLLYNSRMTTIWMISKAFCISANLEVIGRPNAFCDSCLANNATFSELRSRNDWLKTKTLWEKTVSFSTHRLFFLFWSM